MEGGAGDDTYIVNHVNYIVTEYSSGGTDLIQSSVSFTASSYIENLTHTVSGSITGREIILQM